MTQRAKLTASFARTSRRSGAIAATRLSMVRATAEGMFPSKERTAMSTMTCSPSGSPRCPQFPPPGLRSKCAMPNGEPAAAVHPVFDSNTHRGDLKPWELFQISTGQTLRLTMTPMDKHYNSHNPTFPYRGEVVGFHPGEACA